MNGGAERFPCPSMPHRTLESPKPWLNKGQAPFIHSFIHSFIFLPEKNTGEGAPLGVRLRRQPPLSSTPAEKVFQSWLAFRCSLRRVTGVLITGHAGTTANTLAF